MGISASLALVLVSLSSQDQPTVVPGEWVEGVVSAQSSPIVVSAWEDGWELLHPTRAALVPFCPESPGPYRIEARSRCLRLAVRIQELDGELVIEKAGEYGIARVDCTTLEVGRSYQIAVASQYGLEGPFRLRVTSGSPGESGLLSDPDAMRAWLMDASERERGAPGSVAVEVLGELYAGAFEESQGRDTAARAHLERAVALSREELGEHPLYDESMAWLAHVLGELGESERAEELLRAGVDLRRRKLAPGAHALGMALQNYGAFLGNQGRIAESIQYLKESVANLELDRERKPEDLMWGLRHLGIALSIHQEFGESRAALERSLELCEQTFGPDHIEFAVGLKALARLANDEGGREEAVGLLELACAIARSDPEGGPCLAEACGQLGEALRSLGRLEEAADAIQSGIEAARAVALGARYESFALGELGEVRRLQHRYEEAEQAFVAAVESGERSLGLAHPYLGNLYQDYAGLLATLGDYLEAEAYFRRGLDLYRTSFGQDQAWTATGEHNLAGVLEELGRWEEARSLREHALDVQTKRLGARHPETLITKLGLANLRIQLGQVEDALSSLRRLRVEMIQVFGSAHGATRAATNSLALALAERGDFEEALRLQRELVDSSSSPIDRGGMLHNLGSYQYRAGETQAAAESYEAALESRRVALPKGHLDTHSTGLLLAQLRLCHGDPETALRLAGECFEARVERLGADHELVADCSRVQALALMALGRPEEAWIPAQRAFEIGATQFGRSAAFLSESERFAFAATLRKYLFALLATTGANPSMELDALAYGAVLEWKGRISRELTATKERSLASMDAVTREIVRRLQGAQSRLSTELFREEVPDRDVQDARIERLRAERTDLERQLLERSPAPPAPNPGCSAVRDALPSGTALVDFLIHRSPCGAGSEEEVVTAFVLRPGMERIGRIQLGPSAPLRAASSEFLRSLAGVRGVAVSAADTGPPYLAIGNALRRALWDPIAPLVGDAQHVLISPDGFLWTLPFESLPSEEGSFLVETRAFSYVQDARTLLEPTPQPARPARGLLAVGAVEFEAQEERESAEAGAGSDRGGLQRYWEPLASTGRESASVAALFRARGSEEEALELRASAATEEAIKLGLCGRRWVHLATHGFFQPPELLSLWDSASAQEGGLVPPRSERRVAVGLLPGLLSGLACAGANAVPIGAREDGLLTAEEVGWIDLSGCELVVLSACETALGESRSGEGLASLRRAFRLAGARTVISSLWTIDDESTAELMRAFYHRLWQGGGTKLEALRGAQLELLARNRARRAGNPLPRQWAAFVLDGDWR